MKTFCIIFILISFGLCAFAAPQKGYELSVTDMVPFATRALKETNVDLPKDHLIIDIARFINHPEPYWIAEISVKKNGLATLVCTVTLSPDTGEVLVGDLVAKKQHTLRPDWFKFPIK
jgi:hypothetical protein